MSSVGSNYDGYGALGVRPHMIKFTPVSNKISQNKTDHHLSIIVPLVSGLFDPPAGLSVSSHVRVKGVAGGSPAARPDFRGELLHLVNLSPYHYIISVVIDCNSIVIYCMYRR